MPAHLVRKIPVSWEQVVTWCRIIADQARGTGFQSILAIARGGLVPARILSSLLGDIPIWTITAQRYTGTKCCPLKITGKEVLNDVLSPVLVVDEICDAGETIEAITQLLTEGGVDHRVAVLLQKGKSCGRIHIPFCAEYVDEDPSGPEHWYCFPWEREYLDFHTDSLHQ